MSEETKKTTYVIGDDVWNRVVQMVQEGMLMGIDVVDIMRQVRVNVGDNNVLHLTPEYVENVKEQHQKIPLKSSE